MRRSNGRRLNDNRNDGFEDSTHRLNFPLSGKITAGTPAIARRICRLTAMATRCCAITACLPPLQQRWPQFSFTARGWAGENVFVALFALFGFFAGIPTVHSAAYRTGLFLHLQYGCRNLHAMAVMAAAAVPTGSFQRCKPAAQVESWFTPCKLTRSAAARGIANFLVTRRT